MQGRQNECDFDENGRQDARAGMTFGKLNDQDRLLFQDRGARQRRRRSVEPQILSNASVHQSSRRNSAKQPQTIREPAGRVAEFWAVGDGRFVRSFLDTSSRRPEC
jgi:hypothetical protein